MNLEQISVIERAWVVKSVMINRAIILSDIIESYGFPHAIFVNSDKKIEFLINKRLSIILINPSWIEYRDEKRTTKECEFNRGKLKELLKEIK